LFKENATYKWFKMKTEKVVKLDNDEDGAPLKVGRRWGQVKDI
jgi:hypothetical protein